MVIYLYYLIPSLNGILNLVPCPKQLWGVWGSWSECSQTCGNGTKVRARDCYTPAQFRVDPGNCFGEEEEITSCNNSECPRGPGMN